MAVDMDREKEMLEDNTMAGVSHTMPSSYSLDDDDYVDGAADSFMRGGEMNDEVAADGGAKPANRPEGATPGYGPEHNNGY